jgi:hypothetical protein
MYECDTIGCPEYVSHLGQFCLGCTQRNEADDNLNECYDDDLGYDYSNYA